MSISSKLLVASIFTASCASTPPSPLSSMGPTSVSNAHPEYPSSRYICALGVANGGVDEAQNAEDRAKQGVVTQINSSIESEISRISTVDISRSGSRQRVSSNQSAMNTMSQTGSYDHGELIRIVESHDSRTDYRAYACLNRSEAAQVELDENNSRLIRHHEAYGVATAAFESTNVAAFTAAFSEAKQAERGLVGPLSTVRVLLGGVSPAEAQLRREHSELIQHSSELRSNIRVNVSPADQGERLGAEGVRQSLARLGFQASVSSAVSCPSGAGSFSLAVGFEDGCPSRRSSMGQWICAPRLQLELRDCTSNQSVLNIGVEGPTLRGAGSTVELARRQALERLNTDRLDPLISDGLAVALPTP